MNKGEKLNHFDLEERTAKFAENIVTFAKSLPKNEITKPIIVQLVRAGTSIGANYCEANDAESEKDFKHKIGICRKEAHETKYWLRIIKHAIPESSTEAQPLWQEAKELTLIFNASIKTVNKKINLAVGSL